MFRHCKDMQAGEQSNSSPGESLSHCLPLSGGAGGVRRRDGSDDISDHVKLKNNRLKR